jgi:receptor protein-tyrosine kinase
MDRHAGRSYLAANLAVVFAQMGESTLLIDADLRHPRQHEIFKLDNRQGLSMLLGDRCDSDGIQPVSALTNLSVLAAGPVPPNPQELLNRPVFGAILESVTERFDVVLIDTPAFATAMDVSIIARNTGAALLVARKNESRLGTVSGFAGALARAGVNVVGSVLNVHRPERSGR